MKCSTLGLFIFLSIIFVGTGIGKKVLVLGLGEMGCNISHSGILQVLNDGTDNGCAEAAGTHKQLQVDKGGNKWTINKFFN